MKRSKYSSYLTWRSIASYSAINYTQAGMAFLVSMILAKQLGKEQYGYYSYGMIFFSSISVLGSFGMDKTLVRDLVQDHANKFQILFSSTVFKAILGTILSIGVVAWTVMFEENMTKQLMVAFFSLAALVVLLSPKAWYDVNGKIQKHAWMTFFERFVYLLIVITVLLFIENRMLTWVVCSFLILKMVVLITEWKKIGFHFKQQLAKSSFNFKKVVKNNTWIWLAAIGNLLMVQYNQIILEGKLGVKELAAFALAFQFVHFIRILQAQILRLSAPNIAVATKSTDRSEILKSIVSNSMLVLAGTVLLLIPFYFIVPVVINEFIGVEFVDAIPVFNVLLIWILIYGVALINNQFLISLHLQKLYFGTTLFFGIISIGLSIYFIGKFGAKGAAWSLLIAHAGSIFVQMVIVIYHIMNKQRLVSDQ